MGSVEAVSAPRDPHKRARANPQAALLAFALARIANLYRLSAIAFAPPLARNWLARGQVRGRLNKCDETLDFAFRNDLAAEARTAARPSSRECISTRRRRWHATSSIPRSRYGRSRGYVWRDSCCCRDSEDSKNFCRNRDDVMASSTVWSVISDTCDYAKWGKFIALMTVNTYFCTILLHVTFHG